MSSVAVAMLRMQHRVPALTAATRGTLQLGWQNDYKSDLAAALFCRTLGCSLLCSSCSMAGFSLGAHNSQAH